MNQRFVLVVAAVVAAAVIVVPCVARAAVGDAPAVLRIGEDDDGRRLALEVVARRYVHPGGEAPEILMAGAVHIGERGFYRDLHGLLDPLDVVLFEGVRPDPDGEMADAVRVSRLRSLILRHRALHGELPATLEELAESIERAELAGFVRRIAEGESRLVLGYAVDPEAEHGFRLTAPDGGELGGGEGSGGKGIQQRLAGALGLAFQGDAMDHTGANWRNSDMTISQLRGRMRERGAEEQAEALLGMLDGSSLGSRFAGMIMRVIENSPTMGAMGRLMLIEMLSRAEELLEVAPGMEGMMAAILDDRNAVVIGDLRKIIEDEPGVGTVGIIYGAGHLPDLHRRLVEELGYSAAEERWLTAIAVDLEEAGIPAAQAERTRNMIRSAIEMQINAARRRGG